MRTEKKLWRNRKARKELARRLQSENPGLEVVHPHAAGIDVGNSAHYVAVRPRFLLVRTARITHDSSPRQFCDPQPQFCRS
jgi:hypothetical protein